ncbi:MAG TPA: hypothetical protein VNZ22_14365 [Bacillota bacterium]|nr:hypothetical protein [Bacillota bacterium]
MNTTQNLVRTRIAPSAVAIALLVCSAVWLVSAYVYFATSAFRSHWSATPLVWMLILLVAPAMCCAMGIILVKAPRPARASRFYWYALGAASLPVTLGTVLAVWAVKGSLAMAGFGI